MRYLKSFNHLNESSESETLWETITMDDYLNRQEIHGEDESFSDIDKDKIRNGIRYDGYDYSMSGDLRLTVEIANHDSGIGTKKLIEYIIKSPDEWFYVKEYYFFWHKGERTRFWKQGAYRPQKGSGSVYESYIKCDSLEGLIQYIKSRREYLYTL
jgi:hypothetical protein